jgi:hypothetical protein
MEHPGKSDPAWPRRGGAPDCLQDHSGWDSAIEENRANIESGGFLLHMPRKLFLIVVLLLLASAQALAANCDLRCSLMQSAMHSRASRAAGPMTHCQGMAMQGNNEQRGLETCLTANDSCAHNGCGIGLNSINKSSDQDYAGSGKLPASAVALFIDPSRGSGPDRTSRALLCPGSDGRPLTRRPGSSLRI